MPVKNQEQKDILRITGNFQRKTKKLQTEFWWNTSEKYFQEHHK